MNNTLKKYLTIFALSLSGGSIFVLPYLKYVFYDHQIEVMGITNQQSGLLLSMYAVGCMILYIPGGIIADRFSAKKCIFWSLVTTTVLSVVYAVTFNYQLSLVIWLLLAVTTCFVFWTALMKTLRMSGSDEEQGRIFGIYYAGNGVTGAVVNSLALWASTKNADPRASLFNAVMVMATATAVAAVLIWIFLKDDKDEKIKGEESEKFDFGSVASLIRNPIVWIFSLIIFCGYSLYSSTSYFTPYLTDVVGVSPEQSGVFTIIRTYVFMLLAPVGGFMADKVFKSTSKWFMVAFSVLAILFWGVLRIPEGMNPTFISIITLLPGAFGLALYGILFSIIGEAKIPVTVTATAVGIASIIGYTPDLFMSAMFGTWLDKFGNEGYGYIFTFLMIVGVVGAAAAYVIRRRCVKLEGQAGNIKNQA